MEESKKWAVDLLNKYFFFILLAGGVSLISCEEEDRSVGTDIIDIPSTLGDENANSKAKIEFEQTEILAGKITQGDVLTYSYNFTNVGDGPLVISSVTGSCGCTIPRNYPKGKILPGEKGTIEVEFNSDNKWGDQVVTISVVTNTLPSLTQLLIRTEVVVPDNMKSDK